MIYRRPDSSGPASYLTLERGAAVHDRFGVSVGTIERVLVGPGTHLLDVDPVTAAERVAAGYRTQN